MSKREEQYQKVIEKNQQVHEEQAKKKAFKSFGVPPERCMDVKQKIFGNGNRNKI